MNMLKDSVSCGFNKWSIGIGENGEVEIEFGHHPNYGSIQLHDTSVQDLRNIGEMFLAAAHEAEQPTKSRMRKDKHGKVEILDKKGNVVGKQG
jgi:hypothetical protein